MLSKNFAKKAIQTRIETKTNSAKRMFLSRFGYSMGDVYPLIVFSHDRCRFSDKLDRKSNVVKLRDLHTRIRELEDGIGDELEKRVREIYIVHCGFVQGYPSPHIYENSSQGNSLMNAQLMMSVSTLGLV